MSKLLNERKITRNFLNIISEGSLKAGSDGVVSPQELYNHFDLDNDGTVTTDEYVDHIEFHAKNPETLDCYKKREKGSLNVVPCRDSYQSCSNHFLSEPDNIQIMLEPILQSTGATCHTSVAQSLLDVLLSMKECGLI
jgi:hypothetical protein